MIVLNKFSRKVRYFSLSIISSLIWLELELSRLERFVSQLMSLVVDLLKYFKPKSVFNWKLGSSELYATQLRNRYLKGVPLCSTIYGATEGLMGVNLWPLEKTPCYLLVPRSMFFEFIPLEHSYEEQPKVREIALSLQCIQDKLVVDFPILTDINY